MKSRRFPVFLSISLSILGMCYFLWKCTPAGTDYCIVTVSGSNFSNNMSKTYIQFGSLADSGKTTALLVSEGDLLYLLNEPSDNPVMFRYQKSDGQLLKLSTDTACLFKSFLNDRLHSLNFSDSADVAGWMGQKDLSGVPGLRSVYINGMAVQEDVGFLEEIAKLNQSTGLVLENCTQEQIARILPLFQPKWLFLMDCGLGSIGLEIVSNLKNVETLITDMEYEGDAGYMYQMPALGSLVIEGYGAAASASVDFNRIENLTSLTFLSAETESLSSLQLPEHLQSLMLIDCDHLTDISGLNTLSHLRQLNLLSCDTLAVLDPLRNLHHLELLSLPPLVGQQEFADIIGLNPSLKSVGLIGCVGIKDLSPLKELKALVAAEIDLPGIDFATLEQLSSIKLLVIGQDQFESSPEKIEALSKALPNAQVVPGGGFCMGSGWILLVLPFFLAAGFLSRKYKK
jgi:hypothetical protein